jgi:HD-like signal output (HDOD) protein
LATADQGKQNILIVPDKLSPQPHLRNLLSLLKQKNSQFADEQQIQYVVCEDGKDVARTLMTHGHRVKMVFFGPGIEGRPITMARLMSKSAQVVLVVDGTVDGPGLNPLTFKKVRKNLESLGIAVQSPKEATQAFCEPLVEETLIKGLEPANLLDLAPNDRAVMIDRRLETLTKFPSLPETQSRVEALDDMVSPGAWAEAIDPDPITRAVILKFLNSDHYGFRSKITTIEEAVARAGARTIREIVLACSMQEIFKSVGERRIEDFWLHSISTGFFAKIFSTPTDPQEQTASQKAGFDRLKLEQQQIDYLSDLQLWVRLGISKDQNPFVAGLLHDLGKIVTLLCFEDSLELIDAVLESEVTDHEARGLLCAHSSIDIERFLMTDMDHQILGKRIAERWELDPWIQEVIARHHSFDTDNGESPSAMVQLIALANLAANMFACFPYRSTQHPLRIITRRLKKSLGRAKFRNPEAVEAAFDDNLMAEIEDILDRMNVPKSLWKTVDCRKFFTVSFVIQPEIKEATTGFLRQAR